MATGVIIGGFIAIQFMSGDHPVDLNPSTIASLEKEGFTAIGLHLLPEELFGNDALKSAPRLLLLIVGGFFVGFGSRYANGCTSGHAISGMSNLQIPSLLSIIGFFIGGLVMTLFILPSIL